MPSLCGSAEATREWFRAFTAHSFLACRPLRPRGVRHRYPETSMPTLAFADPCPCCGGPCASSRPSCAGNSRSTPLAGFAKGQDRHLMRPTPVLDTHGNTHRPCWLLPDSAPACRVTPDCGAITTKKHKLSSLKMPAARSCFNLPSAYPATLVSLPLRLIAGAPELVAKSP
jgi:hypothetical protein